MTELQFFTMQSENNLYFTVAKWIRIDLLKQTDRASKPIYKVYKHRGSKHEAQTFPDYEMAKAYYIELIADYL